MPSNPYPGLRPYDRADAPWFCGRKGEIEVLVDHYMEQLAGRGRILVYYGPSGVGKTSMVQAGLWPLARVARDIGRLERLEPGRGEDLQTFSRRVRNHVGRTAGGPENRPLLFIDQIDRVFEFPVKGSAMKEEAALQLCTLLDFLKQAARNHRVRVVFGVREPWYTWFEQAHRDPGWVERSLVMLRVGFLSSSGIEEFLREPIARWNAQPGHQFHPVDTLFFEEFFAEMNANPASTPLGNQMLERILAEGEKGRGATWENYIRHGGLIGFIVERAEKTWQLWPPEIQRRLPVFMELFRAAGTETVDGAVRCSAMHPLVADPDAREITARLLEARLLCMKGHRWQDAVVQVAHDRLFEVWHRTASLEHRTSSVEHSTSKEAGAGDGPRE